MLYSGNQAHAPTHAEPHWKHQGPPNAACAHGLAGAAFVDLVYSDQNSDRCVESHLRAQHDSEPPPAGEVELPAAADGVARGRCRCGVRQATVMRFRTSSEQRPGRRCGRVSWEQGWVRLHGSGCTPPEGARSEYCSSD